MSPPRLSNLQLRANLLSGNYQREMARLTAAEVRDIWSRNPNLRGLPPMTPDQRRQISDALFQGQRDVSMDDDDRRRAWLELFAQHLDEAVATLGQDEIERAFEILCITEPLRVMDSAYAAQAAAWGDRVRAMLARPPLRLTRDQADQRLEVLLGILPVPEEQAGGSVPEPATGHDPRK